MVLNRLIRSDGTTRRPLPMALIVTACLGCLAPMSSQVWAQTALPGRTVESLLDIAREKKPGVCLHAVRGRSRPGKA